jgi:nickel/cobalt homeostasis protein
MKIQAFAALMSIVLVTALGGCASSERPRPVQYGQYPDRYYYPQDRYYPSDVRGGYYPPSGEAYDRSGPLWRPGDVLASNSFDYIVADWDARGLGRPPRGHLWVRVGYQFVLVRERDRMIARVINFD